MKLCAGHWSALRDAIRDRGLWKFVAESGEEAHRRVLASLDAPDSRASFDPLMGANFRIFSNAIQTVGLPLLAEPDVCPICWLKAHCECGQPDCGARFEEWITFAADGSLAYAKELGLVGST